MDKCFVSSISSDSQRKLSPLLPTFYWQTKHMGLGQGQKAVWPDSRTCDGKDWGCLFSLTPQDPTTCHKDSGVFAECWSLLCTGLEDPNDRQGPLESQLGHHYICLGLGPGGGSELGPGTPTPSGCTEPGVQVAWSHSGTSLSSRGSKSCPCSAHRQMITCRRAHGSHEAGDQ